MYYLYVYTQQDRVPGTLKKAFIFSFPAGYLFTGSGVYFYRYVVHHDQAFPLQYSHVFPNAWEYVYSHVFPCIPMYSHVFPCIPMYVFPMYSPQPRYRPENFGNTREYTGIHGNTREYCIPNFPTALGIHVFPCIPNVFPMYSQ
jgi:hypothetical protein